jgi:hypothetical protein
MSKRLTQVQERTLRTIFEHDPGQTKYSDVPLSDGNGRNPTYQILRRAKLLEYIHLSGNSFRAALTLKGIHYLHGEEE